MNKQTASRMVEMLNALAPFARLADEYDGFEDELPVLVAGNTMNPVRVTVGDLRAARAAMTD